MGRGVDCDRAAPPEEPAGRKACRRPPGDFGQSACASGRLPLVRLSDRIGTACVGTQPVQPLVAARLVLTLLDGLVGAGVATKSTAIDGTYVEAQRAAFEQGASGSGDRRLTRRLNDQGPVLADAIGRPCALVLTPGNVSDAKAVSALLERAGRMRHMLRDKGYDADRLGTLARHAGATPSSSAATASALSLRQGPLPRSVPHRKRLLPPQGLSPRRHPLRQVRRQLPPQPWRSPPPLPSWLQMSPSPNWPPSLERCRIRTYGVLLSID